MNALTMHQLIDAKAILPAPDWRAAARMKGAATMKAKGAAREARVSRLIAANAGAHEIADAEKVHLVTIYNVAKKLGVKIPGSRDCRPYTPKKETHMASMPAPALVPSVNAIKAQAAMFRLLDTHFDPDKGSYAAGYDDARIAKECGLAASMVTAFRREGFGEMKETPELAAIRADVATLKKMLGEVEARLAKATGAA